MSDMNLKDIFFNQTRDNLDDVPVMLRFVVKNIKSVVAGKNIDGKFIIPEQAFDDLTFVEFDGELPVFTTKNKV